MNEQYGSPQGEPGVPPPHVPQQPPVAPPAPAAGPPPIPPPDEPLEEMVSGPAEFPRGFWRRLDYMLHNPNSILESLRSDHDLWQMARIFLGIAIAMAAIYGAVMGATNLLQASPMVMGNKGLMILTSSIKVPVLFLFTLVIVIPPVYVANTFVGPRLGFRQLVTVLLASVAVTSIVLASAATVAFFFALTTRSYHFIKLLHVLFFTYAGLSGLRFFQKSIKAVAPLGVRLSLGRLFLGTLVLYIFVGTQLAWVLRPFVGDPEKEFQLFRPRQGNFYESVWHSFKKWTHEQFGEEKAPPAKQPPDPDSSGDRLGMAIIRGQENDTGNARRPNPGAD